jgi:adenylate cyclase
MKIGSLFSHFRKNRRIQVHILTIFLALLGLSSLAISRYTYKHYYRDINELSQVVIGETNSFLLEKIRDIKDEAELAMEIIKGSVPVEDVAKWQDPDYLQFLINVLKSELLLTEIMIANPSGDYLAVMDANLIGMQYFQNNSLEKLPRETKFAVRIVVKKEDVFEEVWKYVDEKGMVLALEAIVPASYDFEKDPWVLQMSKDQSLKWAIEPLPRGIILKQSPSITVSDVVKNALGNSAIVSIGVTLEKLSAFILQQNIAKNGFAVILDEKGKISVPLSEGSLTARKKLFVEKGYEEFQKNKNSDFVFSLDEEKVLFSINPSFAFSGKQWFLAVLVPFNDFFGGIVKTQNSTRVFAFCVFILCGFITYFFSKYISRPIVELDSQVQKIREFDFSEGLPIRSRMKEIFDLECSINTMRSALRSFGRYVPKEIVKSLVKYGNDVHLGGDRLEISIMFSDVKNFTTISESLPIEELMKLLSTYFDVLSKIVLECGGTIDKYIGDSIMAFWGAPIKIADHAERASLSCLQCLAAIKQQKVWTTRFGVHTGEVIVGNIGTSERINYTVIGDAVNVASRLESINKEYGTFIMISETVQQKIGPHFVTRPIDFVAVKGKKSKIKIFELMGTKEGALAPSLAELELAKQFCAAYQSFEEGRFEEARQRFQEIERIYPEDIPTKKLQERLKSLPS